MPYKSISSVVASSNNVSNPTVLTPVLPTRANTDLLVLVTSCRSNTATVATPSGWTLWPGFPKRSATASGGSIYIFYKEVVGGESNPAISWTGVATGTTGDSSQAVIINIDKVQVSSPSDVTPPAATDASSANPSIPTLTTVSADAEVIGISLKVSDTAQTGTVANSFTERGDFHTTTGTGHHLYIATRTMASPGSTGASVVTESNATAARCLSVAIAVKERIPVTYFGAISKTFTFGSSIAGNISLPLPPFPTVSVVDNFNGRDEQPPAAPWKGSTAVNGFRVIGDILLNPSSTWDGIYWDVPYPSADQECFVTLSQLGVVPNTSHMQLHIRRDHSANTAYVLDIIPITTDIYTLTLYRRIAGSDQLLWDQTVAIFSGDSVGLSAKGNEIYVWYKPVGLSWGLVFSETDTSIPNSGVAAIYCNDSVWHFDNWGAPPSAQIENFPTQNVLDNFNRANSTLGAPNWTGSWWPGYSPLAVVSNQAKSSSGIGSSTWNTVQTPDCEIFTTLATRGSVEIVIYARATNLGLSNFSGYQVSIPGSVWQVYKVVNGTPTPIGVGATKIIADGGAIGMSIVGSTIKTFYKAPAGSWELLETVIDSTISTGGYIGIEIDGTDAIIDDFGGGSIGPVTLYGSTSLQVAFNSTTKGQRKTFSQISQPISFGAIVSGQRKAFGQISLPITFGKDVRGQRKAFGQVSLPILFGKDTAGRRTTFSKIDRPFIFSAFVNGNAVTPAVTHYGSLTMPMAFNASVTGSRKTFGQIALPINFSKDIQARKQTFGKVDSPFVFGKAVSGQRKTFGQIAFPINVGISTAGYRPGNTLYGALSLPITFGKDVRGQRKAFGQLALPITFAKDVKGVRTTFGKIDFPIVFTNYTLARKHVYGQLSMATIFGKETDGRRKTFSQVSMPIIFSKSVAARRKTFGQVALPIIFSKEVAGTKKTFGQISAPFIFGAATKGARTTFSSFELPMNLIVEIKSGPVKTYSQISLPIIFDAHTAGRVLDTGIVLNDADNIYLGTMPVVAIYVEDQKVWPS